MTAQATGMTAAELERQFPTATTEPANAFPAAPLCPVCNGEMWDNRGKKKNLKSPDFACKAAGTWDPATKTRSGCNGVIFDITKGK